jgi:NADPH:quinone reductase
MRASVVKDFGPPESLQLAEMPDPEAQPGTVVVRVEAAGVNFPDVLVVAGTYQILPSRPFSPGKEVAGTVHAIGEGVSDLSVGDRVMAQVEYGGYAELVEVPAGQVVPLPDELPAVEAAAMGLTGLTAHVALQRRARLRPGETVLVTGAGGGVGAAGVQLAKAWGATVIAVARDEERAAVAADQGADHVLVAVDTLRDDVRRLTDGRGADVVLETVGGDVFDQALRATAWEGRVVVIGFASGDLPTVKAGLLLVKNIGVLGLQVSDYRDREPEAVREALADLIALRVAGRFAVPVARTYSLAEAGAALADVARGGLTGRVVLTCTPATDPGRGDPS